MEKNNQNKFWQGKNVLLTGHTGFKGSWMSLWLLELGANVSGYALKPSTTPSLFDEAKLSSRMNSRIGDIRDLESTQKMAKELKPDIIIHMAAQPLVRYSYDAPVETYMTNVMGTVHVFEAARATGSVQTILNVTSDKCYENIETHRGYTEADPMGGSDPYSNSKGCAELVTSAYRKSFFQKAGIGLASGRAGNVIGGGDWAQDRLVPDIVRSVLNKKPLTIRNPHSLRPWQHVLEPLNGYLTLAQKLFEDGKTYSESFNFGPAVSECCNVENVIELMNGHWENLIKYEIVQTEDQHHEAKLLTLDCTKAKKVLNWEPKWSTSIALEKTVIWNKHRLDNQKIDDVCLRQIREYSAAMPLNYKPIS